MLLCCRDGGEQDSRFSYLPLGRMLEESSTLLSHHHANDNLVLAFSAHFWWKLSAQRKTRRQTKATESLAGCWWRWKIPFQFALWISIEERFLSRNFPSSCSPYYPTELMVNVRFSCCSWYSWHAAVDGETAAAIRIKAAGVRSAVMTQRCFLIIEQICGI